jgi:arylsulfatase A-like enzyme
MLVLAVAVTAYTAFGISGCVKRAPARTVQPEVEPTGRQLVLIVNVDTLRRDRLGIYGNRRGLTPSIDRLGKNGVVFDAAFAASDHTRPSVASLMTGLYPSEHRFWIEDSTQIGFVQEPNLATLLRAAGFHAYWVNANPNTHRFLQYFDDGWTDWGPDPKTKPYAPARPLFERALQMVAKAPADGNVFLYVQPADSHGPYLPDHYDRDLFEGDSIGAKFPDFMRDMRPSLKLPKITDAQLANAANRYDNEVREMDAELGRFLDRLLPQFKRHLIVLAADHGESFLEHGVGGHWVSLYNEEVRIPLAVSGTGIRAGRRVAQLTSNVDVAPFVLDYLRLPQPVSNISGESFFAAVSSRVHAPPGPHPRMVFSETILPVDGYLGDLYPARKFSERGAGMRPMVRAYLYQTSSGAVVKELRSYGAKPAYPGLIGVRVHQRERYDLSVDPAEARNLFDTMPLPDEMSQGIRQWEGRWSLVTPAAPVISQSQLDRLRALGYVR